jgi:hypothetical protein
MVSDACTEFIQLCLHGEAFKVVSSRVLGQHKHDILHHTLWSTQQTTPTEQSERAREWGVVGVTRGVEMQSIALGLPFACGALWVRSQALLRGDATSNCLLPCATCVCLPGQDKHVRLLSWTALGNTVRPLLR